MSENPNTIEPDDERHDAPPGENFLDASTLIGPGRRYSDVNAMARNLYYWYDRARYFVWLAAKWEKVAKEGDAQALRDKIAGLEEGARRVHAEMMYAFGDICGGDAT